MADSNKIPALEMDQQTEKSGSTLRGTKSRRVRTGCLTCRERHLKCDETLPKCQNCTKSGRTCKRGMRLNFIDTQVAVPPYTLAPPPRVPLHFQDESRGIAAEYVGGFERYPPLNQMNAPLDNQTSSAAELALTQPAADKSPLHAPARLLSPFHEPIASGAGSSLHINSEYSANRSLQEQNSLVPKYPPDHLSNSTITTPDQVLLIQVFVEEVAVWMDSMDASKHFSEIVPVHALNEPMLMNAIWACGARHLYLVNASYSEDKAIHYYNAASQGLLSHLQNPHRDPVLCATAAVILNVYEVMCESPMQRMNHIAGARALIKECRWNGKSPGIGGACFWVNVGMELFSCLHFNWQLAWDPDTWHMDMETELVPANGLFGDEDVWAHRMVYICAKVANFRASIPRLQALNSHERQLRIQQRCHEWETYKRWCDEWARCVPRSMMPICYVQPWQTSKSAFPEVWLLKRSAVIGRLFYHLTCMLLARTHPIESENSPDMREMQQTHAYDICGIIAHVKDRGVAATSIRILAIAAECLDTRESQEEILQTIDKIDKETGWRISFLKSELQAKWKWNAAAASGSASKSHTMTTTAAPTSNGSNPISSSIADHTGNPQDPGSSSGSYLPSTTSMPTSSAAIPKSDSRSRFPSGIINPIMASADFSMLNHPYQEHYVAPHDGLSGYHYS